MPPEPASLEEVSHLALKVGRILFQNNADTAEVRLVLRDQELGETGARATRHETDIVGLDRGRPRKLLNSFP